MVISFIYTLTNSHTHLFTILGQLNSKTATGGGLSHSSFSSHENPLKSVLIDNVFKRWFREVTVVKFCHGGRISMEIDNEIEYL
jgi:hypothetical protein